MKLTKESPEKAGTGPNGEEKTSNLALQSQEGAGEKQDAISLLKADHREVEQMFDRYATIKRRAERAKIVKQACQALTIHAILEEEIFYPACRELIDDEPLDEAQVEHDSAKILINELKSGTPEEAFYDAKFKVLAEQVRHHIREEEGQPDSIFAKVEAAGADLVALGEKLRERKAELSSQAGERALPAPLRSFKNAAQMRKEGALSSHRGRDDEDRGSLRYRDEEDAGRRRDEQGRFMSDGDYGDRRGQDHSYRERDESGRDGERGYRASSRERPSYHGEEYSSRIQRTPERDESGRFVGDDEQRAQRHCRTPEGGQERRSSGGGRHGGWSGDPEGHAEAARKGREEREGGRSSRDEDVRRSSSQISGRRYEERARENEDEDPRGHSGWFGDPEGHAEASRRGWEHRR